MYQEILVLVVRLHPLPPYLNTLLKTTIRPALSLKAYIKLDGAKYHQVHKVFKYGQVAKLVNAAVLEAVS